MHNFIGQRSHGPFGKLLEVCSEVGWSVKVPGIFDHDGLWHSFLDTTDAVLFEVAGRCMGTADRQNSF